MNIRKGKSQSTCTRSFQGLSSRFISAGCNISVTYGDQHRDLLDSVTQNDTPYLLHLSIPQDLYRKV